MTNPGPVAVGEEDQAPLRRQTAEEGQPLPVLEHAEAPGLHHRGVHHLLDGVLVVAALHHDDLPDVTPHLRPSWASSMSSSFSSSAPSTPATLLIRRSVS